MWAYLALVSVPAAFDANANAVLYKADQLDLELPHQRDQRTVKAPKQDLRRKQKALAVAAALLITAIKIKHFGPSTGTSDSSLSIEGHANPFRRYCY